MAAKLPPVIRPICGEYRGWNAHQRFGEESCARCSLARNEYMRDYRRRTGHTKASLYTAEEIELLKTVAVEDALLAYHSRTLHRAASRLKRGRRILR